MGRKDDAVNAGLNVYVQTTGTAPDRAVVQALEELADDLIEEDDEQ